MYFVCGMYSGVIGGVVKLVSAIMALVAWRNERSELMEFIQCLLSCSSGIHCSLSLDLFYFIRFGGDGLGIKGNFFPGAPLVSDKVRDVGFNCTTYVHSGSYSVILTIFVRSVKPVMSV